MALISTIRNRFGAVLIGLIAISMGAFVFNDLFNTSGSTGQQQRVVGEISGVSVPYEEFEQRVSIREDNFRMAQGDTPDENTRARFQQEVWNQFIYNIAFGNQLDELGIKVHEEELVDLVQGNYIHPQIQQQFRNEAGQFDKNRLITYLQFISRDYNPQSGISQQDFVRMQYNWKKFEEELPLTRRIEKYNALMSKSAFVTDVQAKRKYMDENTTASGKILYVPYISISDSAINVSDADLNNYLQKNKELYRMDEPSVSLDYVVFPVTPSAEDSAIILDEITNLKAGLEKSENDSLFALAKADNYMPAQYSSLANVPELIQNQYETLDTGMVFGPVLEENAYTLYKISGIKEDTVYSARASHILFKPASDSDEDLATALADAKKVLREIQGGADFAEMAGIHGTDATRTKGGDLGWFTEGRMVQEFNDAVMQANSLGLLPSPVKTDFGYHIIKVTGVKTNKNFKITMVDREITAGEDTREIAYQEAAGFAAENTNLEDFRAAAEKMNKEVLKAESLRPQDRFLRAAGNARQTIRWAFEEGTVEGEVSDVGDLEDGYIVAAVAKKAQAGIPSLDVVREQILPKVRNELKAEQIKAKLPASGGLDERLSAYGTDASILNANNVTMSTSSLPGIGFDPKIAGAMMGMEQGEVSEAIAGDNGVAVIEVTAKTAAQEKENYATSKSALINQAKAKATNGPFEAIKDAANIEDNRTSFF